MSTKTEQAEKAEVTILIERAMNGDDSVWGEVYEKTRRYVYFIALKFLRNEQDAEDITQDVYIQVIRSVGQLYSADSFYGWLRRIIFSKCTDFTKKKKPVLAEDIELDLDNSPEIDDAFLPDMVLDSAETRRMVMELIDALPDVQRQTVLFYYYDEMTVDQIAALMECSAGTVKSRLNYARAKIKEGVKEHERKGIKLYGIGTLPILSILLQQQAQALELPVSLGTGIAAILGESAAATGTAASGTAASGTAAAGAIEAGSTATTAALSTKVIAGITAAVIAAGAGVAGLVYMNQSDEPVSVEMSETVSETVSETITTTETTYIQEIALSETENFVIPDNVIEYMENLYDTLLDGDISKTYSIMSDESIHEWLNTFDHTKMLTYFADTDSIGVFEPVYNDSDYNYRDSIIYHKDTQYREPRLQFSVFQSNKDYNNRSIMIDFGKPENGYIYHFVNLHYNDGEKIQYDWTDLTYQDGKATGAFKRYMINPLISSDIFARGWILETGNIVDGAYEGDMYTEYHEGRDVIGYTLLMNYKNGILQPLGEADVDGYVPYAYYVDENYNISSQQLQTKHANEWEWTNRSPYDFIELW
jgi:RNA polymerase sigma factor (sigma-70 family)